MNGTRWNLQIPKSKIFVIYLIFIVLYGISIFQAINLREAVYAFTTQLLSLLITIVFYTLLTRNEPATKKALWISAGIAKIKEERHPTTYSNAQEAYRHAPYDKKNLHALGHDAYYLNHDLEAAEFYLNEAIRISPNYLDPYFTLAQIYIEEGDLDHAKETVDKIYMDKDKKDILIRDIPFFEPDNIEATRQKIEADFEKTQQLKMVISSFSNLNEEKNTIKNEVQSKKPQ